VIMCSWTSRWLGWVGCLALLPLATAWAQDRRPGDDRRQDRREDRKPDSKEVDRARAEVEKLRDELTAHLQKARELEERLRAAANRLNQLEGRGGGVRVIIIRDGDRGGPGQGEPGRRFEGPGSRPGDRQPGPGQGPGDRRGPDNRRGNPPGPGFPGGGPGGPGGPGGGPGSGPGPGFPPPGGGGPGFQPPPDQRFQEIERRLEMIMHQLEELRRQMRGPQQPGGPPQPGHRGPGGPPGAGPQNRRHDDQRPDAGPGDRRPEELPDRR
jgi:hypothetical protein